MQQNICWLNVPVDNALVVQVRKAHDDHFHNADGFLFIQFGLFFVEVRVQIALIAILGDDVGVVLGLVDVVKFHEVLAVDAFEGFNFLIQKVAVDGVVEHFHVNDFYSDFLLSEQVLPLKDGRRVAFADLLVQVIRIVLDYFLGLVGGRHQYVAS